MTSLRRVCLLSLLVFLSGCEDAALPVPESAPDIEARFSAGPEDDMPETRINWRMQSIQMPMPSGSFPAPATLQTAMSYNSYRASIGATMYLRGRNSETRTFTPRERVQFNQYFDNIFDTGFQLMVPGPCGHAVEGDVTYRVWKLFIGYQVIDDKRDYGRADGSQLGCTGEEERTERYRAGSGGGGGGCDTCLAEEPTGYTWCKVRYKYWLDTGEIFSTTVLYCW